MKYLYIILISLFIFVKFGLAQESPNNTLSPPAPFIIDSNGGRWSIGNMTPPANPPISIDVDLMVYCNKIVYAREISTQLWYKGIANQPWILVGKTNPCP